MCTLSVITRDQGFLLAMNRDEQLTRGKAIPPAQTRVAATTAVYPRDGAGGTWIAVNNHGVALALLNWNDIPQPEGEKTRSRGAMIPALIGCTSLEEVQATLPTIDLRATWPFRIAGIFAAEKKIVEWRWDGEKVVSQSHDWTPKHWFSSSVSDAQALSQRGSACAAAWSLEDAGSLPWLRRLHASHANGPGPFSLCVHRENVGTLSFTEIECGPEKIDCRYFEGSPCAMTRTDVGDPVELDRAT